MTDYSPCRTSFIFIIAIMIITRRGKGNILVRFSWGCLAKKSRFSFHSKIVGTIVDAPWKKIKWYQEISSDWGGWICRSFFNYSVTVWSIGKNRGGQCTKWFKQLKFDRRILKDLKDNFTYIDAFFLYWPPFDCSDRRSVTGGKNDSACLENLKKKKKKTNTGR